MTTGQVERLFPPLAAGEVASRLLLASAGEVIARQLRLMAQAGGWWLWAVPASRSAIPPA